MLTDFDKKMVCRVSDKLATQYDYIYLFIYLFKTVANGYEL